MGKHKKTVTLYPALTLALALVLTGCGGVAKSADTPAPRPAAQPSDTIAPSVLSVTPGGASGAASGNLVITFSEAMNTSSAGTVQLNSLTALSGGAWSAGNLVFTIPYNGLATGVTYKVNISGFTDRAGNVMNPDSIHSFSLVTNAPVSGGIAVNSEASWNTAINTIKNGGNNKTYTINVTGSFEITGSTETTPYFPATFGRAENITVTVNGATGSEVISVKTGTKAVILKIDSRQNVVMNNINFKGHSGNQLSLVNVDDARASFTMKGTASIFGNNSDANFGGGVESKGAFVMQDGASVYDNKSAYSGSGGGGVAVKEGAFIMKGGLIKTNTAGNKGGGIYTFPGSGDTADIRIGGGAVYGSSADASLRNTASASGAALYVNSGSGAASAQYGAFSGDSWTGSGALATDNRTITVVNGVRQ